MSASDVAQQRRLAEAADEYARALRKKEIAHEKEADHSNLSVTVYNLASVHEAMQVHMMMRSRLLRVTVVSGRAASCGVSTCGGGGVPRGCRAPLAPGVPAALPDQRAIGRAWLSLAGRPCSHLGGVNRVL